METKQTEHIQDTISSF